MNLRGELVGINTAIIGPSGGNVGIGFAIPSNIVAVIMRELIENGEVRRGRIGVTVGPLDPELAAALGLQRVDGIVVMDVEPGSVADNSGIRTGDVLTHIADRAIRKVGDYRSQAAVSMVGDQVDVSLIRDGKPINLALEISDDNVVQVGGERLDPRLNGAVFSDFRDEAEPDSSSGVLVMHTDRAGAAFRYGLRDGDIIVAANRRVIRAVGDLWQELRANAVLRLRIYRSGRYGEIWLR